MKFKPTGVRLSQILDVALSQVEAIYEKHELPKKARADLDDFVGQVAETAYFTGYADGRKIRKELKQMF